MTSRQLAEVEQIIARIMADQDLTPSQRLLAQRDTWCEQAYQTAMAIRRIYRRVAVLRDSAPPWVRPALTAVLDEVIRPALVDTMPPTTADGDSHACCLVCSTTMTPGIAHYCGPQR